MMVSEPEKVGKNKSHILTHSYRYKLRYDLIPIPYFNGVLHKIVNGLIPRPYSSCSSSFRTLSGNVLKTLPKDKKSVQSMSLL